MKVGIIGTGLMGFPMAINIAKKFELKSFSRTFEKMKGLEKYKITLCNTLESLSRNTDVIISILPGDKEVIERGVTNSAPLLVRIVFIITPSFFKSLINSRLL